MDTSNPSPMVNGELLRRYMGRRVRCVLKVIQADGAKFLGQTSDNQQVNVKQAQGPFTQYVEVTGVVDGDHTMRADHCTNFGDNFDLTSYNQLCQMANGEHQDIFV